MFISEKLFEDIILKELIYDHYPMSVLILLLS
jgi:hypothetical protein